MGIAKHIPGPSLPHTPPLSARSFDYINYDMTTKCSLAVVHTVCIGPNSATPEELVSTYANVNCTRHWEEPV